jgi:hypothetical protein
VTRSSNIISDASSCFHCFPGLFSLCQKQRFVNNVCDVTHRASGMNWLSHTCEKGPWPRSWQRPASWTHPTSLSVILSSGCWSLRCWTMQRARWATPNGSVKRVRSTREDSWNGNLDSARIGCERLRAILCSLCRVV